MPLIDRVDPSVSSKVGFISIALATFSFWFSWGIGPEFFTVSATQIFIVIAFGACVFQWMVYGDAIPHATRQALHPILWVSTAMILVGMASMVVAPDPVLTIRFLSRWVFGILYLVSIVQFVTLDAERLRKVIRAFLYGGVATVPALVVGYF